MLFHVVAVWTVLCGVEEFPALGWAATGDFDKVVNGSEATPGQYPFMASLRSNGSHMCGATVLNENWVLTTAFCTAGRDPASITLLVGVVDRFDEQNGQLRTAAEVIIHPDFDGNYNFNSNIALIKLDAPLVLSEVVQPVQLPAQGQQTPAYTVSEVVGWGSTKHGGPYSPTLQWAEQLVLSDEDCIYFLYAAYNDSQMLCAKVNGTWRAPCTGDAGGPLMANGEQVGILSFPSVDCVMEEPYPGLYTKVAAFVDWILFIVSSGPSAIRQIIY